MSGISHELWMSSVLGQDLSDAEARELFLVSRRETYDEGKLIFAEGDPANSFFLIVDGAVDVEKSAKDGTAVAIASLDPGAVVGEMSLLIQEPRSAGARVKRGPATVLRVEWKDFQTLMNENRAASQKLVLALARLLAQRLKLINLRVAELTNEARAAPGADKFAEKLDELARFKAKLFKDWNY